MYCSTPPKCNLSTFRANNLLCDVGDDESKEVHFLINFYLGIYLVFISDEDELEHNFRTSNKVKHVHRTRTLYIFLASNEQTLNN